MWADWVKNIEMVQMFLQRMAHFQLKYSIHGKFLGTQDTFTSTCGEPHETKWRSKERVLEFLKTARVRLECDASQVPEKSISESMAPLEVCTQASPTHNNCRTLSDNNRDEPVNWRAIRRGMESGGISANSHEDREACHRRRLKQRRKTRRGWAWNERQTHGERSEAQANTCGCRRRQWTRTELHCCRHRMNSPVLKWLSCSWLTNDFCLPALRLLLCPSSSNTARWHDGDYANSGIVVSRRGILGLTVTLALPPPDEDRSGRSWMKGIRIRLMELKLRNLKSNNSRPTEPEILSHLIKVLKVKLNILVSFLEWSKNWISRTDMNAPESMRRC